MEGSRSSKDKVREFVLMPLYKLDMMDRREEGGDEVVSEEDSSRSPKTDSNEILDTDGVKSPSSEHLIANIKVEDGGVEQKTGIESRGDGERTTDALNDNDRKKDEGIDRSQLLRFESHENKTETDHSTATGEKENHRSKASSDQPKKRKREGTTLEAKRRKMESNWLNYKCPGSMPPSNQN